MELTHALAARCLDAIVDGTISIAQVDALQAQLAQPLPGCTLRAHGILLQVQVLARQAATAIAELADRNTPLSDMHGWTDQLEECRRAVPALRRDMHLGLDVL